jgi:proton-coupled amino acid transporter
MVPIVCSLEPRQKHVFGRIFLQAMAFVTLLFTSFGALGYACFGADTVMPVTLNVHASAASGAALRLGYSFAVVCTFPLQMMPIADMVEAALAAPPCLLRRPSVGRRLIARLGLIGLTCTAAVYGASQFDHFISLVGVLCSVPLAFVLPSLIYLRLCARLGIGTAHGKAAARLALIVGPLAMLGGSASVALSWNDVH